MKKFLFFSFFVLLVLSCATPVKLTEYPTSEVGKYRNPEPELCEENSLYKEVNVLMEFPEKDHVRLGSLLLKQKSPDTSILTVSTEERIKKARIKACKWGGDAIVVVGSESESSTFGTQESGENRIVVIKMLE